MGMYMYRVHAKLVKLVDGRKAHVADYAYKPWHDPALDNKLHMKTGCFASERMTLKSDLIVTLDDDKLEGRLYHNPRGLKVFLDDATFGTESMPYVGRIEAAAGGFRIIPKEAPTA